tara:strand:- start:117 stop:317 length:201 start_codon:yes stop_codon:yes gene_type:complete
MDTDHIIAGVVLVFVTLTGVSLFLLLAIKDKVNSFDKKLNAQSQKFTRLVEWVNEKKGVKRKGRDD